MKHLFRFNTKSLGILALVFLLPLTIDPAISKPPNCTGVDTRPSCQDDGGGGVGTRDLPADALFFEDSEDAVTSDGLDYIDGQERVRSVIGRSDGQFVLSTSNKATSGRGFCLYYDESLNDDPPAVCGDFRGCRVAAMTTARVQYGGKDLRLLKKGGEAVVIPLWINLHDNRQNFWHVRYIGVRVKSVEWDGDNPTAWEIDTDAPGSGEAIVSRIIDNQYVDPKDCGGFVLPFHLSVDLQ